MTDTELALKVKRAYVALCDAVNAARAAGLKVDGHVNLDDRCGDDEHIRCLPENQFSIVRPL